ncbi:hypothetical protein LXL04_019719 [Taraxacum kok-saghyz]
MFAEREKTIPFSLKTRHLQINMFPIQKHRFVFSKSGRNWRKEESGCMSRDRVEGIKHNEGCWMNAGGLGVCCFVECCIGVFCFVNGGLLCGWLMEKREENRKKQEREEGRKQGQNRSLKGLRNTNIRSSTIPSVPSHPSELDRYATPLSSSMSFFGIQIDSPPSVPDHPFTKGFLQNRPKCCNSTSDSVGFTVISLIVGDHI